MLNFLSLDNSESGVSLYQLEKDLFKYIAVTSLLTNPRRELKRMTSLREGKNCVCYKMSQSLSYDQLLLP